MEFESAIVIACLSNVSRSFQNYVDYHKCIAAKGEEFAPCKQFLRAYHSLCPNEWISRFDEQRENGAFPASLEP
ncbi:Cytochrome c oxidase subunit 6B [Tulasnella sp. 427]|nr:Cytochrome c oxidase subunit 6B [Tulasnella sp. 427]